MKRDTTLIAPAPAGNSGIPQVLRTGQRTPMRGISFRIVSVPLLPYSLGLLYERVSRPI